MIFIIEINVRYYTVVILNHQINFFLKRKIDRSSVTEGSMYITTAAVYCLSGRLMFVMHGHEGLVAASTNCWLTNKFDIFNYGQSVGPQLAKKTMEINNNCDRFWTLFGDLFDYTVCGKVKGGYGCWAPLAYTMI